MFNRKNIFLKQTIDLSDTRQQGTVRQSPGQEVINISFGNQLGLKQKILLGIKRLIMTTFVHISEQLH